MRGLWKVIALMAENKDGFTKGLSGITASSKSTLLDNIQLGTVNNVPQVFNLAKQPTQQTLASVDQYLRGIDSTLMLSCYELAEVNRLSYESNAENPPFKSLSDYWAGLHIADSTWRGSDAFMEAVGALSGDAWTRSHFALGNVRLTNWFAVNPAQEQHLRTNLVAGSAADLAASIYAANSWSHVCLSVIAMSDSWFTTNS